MAVSPNDARRRWRWLALAGALLLLALAGYLASQQRADRQAPVSVTEAAPATSPGAASAAAQFTGSASCAGCHDEQHQAWRDSQHHHAMAHATAETVLADFAGARFEYAGTVSRFEQREGRFFVTTDGSDGELVEHEVLYTFGLDPLQQYVVDLGQGRLQALSIAWDTRPAERGGQRWFHLYPGEQVTHTDPLHWTGPAQNLNFMCADCHVTDYRKGFDAQAQVFTPAWSELGVGCEACHGPGSRHLHWAETGEHTADLGLTALLDERRDMHWLHEVERVTARRSEVLVTDKEQQVCAQCHSLRSAVAEGYHAGLPLLDFYRPELLSDPLYFADGQQREEVFISGNFAQSRMHAAGVTCSDCHEPHSQKLRAEGNALCSSCHLPSEFDRPAHHRHAPDSSGAQCVSCHMPERTYMVIDPRRDHSISVPRPDLAQQLGAPDACSSCHTERDAPWAAQQIAGWFPGGRWQEASHATTIAAADLGQPAAQQGLVELLERPQLPPIVRGSAALRLRPPFGPAQLRALAQGLGDSDPLVRLGSVRALEEASPEQRLHLLAPLLDDPLRSLRSLVASQLADVPMPEDRQAAFRHALAEFEAELELHADRASHLGQLGLLRLRQGRTGEAEQAWDSAISAAPLEVGNYLNLADLYRIQGREKTAERLLRDALERLPKEGMLHYALGLSLVRQQQRESALDHLRRAWELQPENPRTGYVFAVALEPTAPEEALRILRQAMPLHPQDRELLWAGASFAYQHGQPELAGEFIDALLQRDPDDRQALQLRQRLGGSDL